MPSKVASFGDFFADTRTSPSKANQIQSAPELSVEISEVTKPKMKRATAAADEPIKCLTYKDPFGSVYKKCALPATRCD
jgi:nitrite reductase (NAD(P)H)